MYVCVCCALKIERLNRIFGFRIQNTTVAAVFRERKRYQARLCKHKCKYLDFA